MEVAGGLARTRRRRLKGIEIREGSVREARLAAGLSLAGVAGTDLTRAAIHLVETGRARPSMPTLELIARRTGKPLSFFMTLPAQADSRRYSETDMLEIETLIQTGRHAEVIQAAAEVLAKEPMAPDEARLHLWLAIAHMTLREGRPAIEHAQQARRLFEALNDSWMAVESLDVEAFGLLAVHDRGCLEVAGRALEECRSLQPPVPATEAKILGHMGAMHAAFHDWGRAISAYEEALVAAGSLRDMGRMARMYQDLSVVYNELGDVSRQLAYSQKALGLHSVLRDRAAMALSENNLGLAYLRQGDYERAHRHFLAALQQLAEIGVEAQVSNVQLSLAELHLLTGDLDQARSSAESAIEMGARLGERLNVGLAHQFLGRIAAAAGDDVATDSEFEQALAIFNDAEAEERAIECHAAYAEVLEARGDARRALWHARKALVISRPRLGRETADPESAAG